MLILVMIEGDITLLIAGVLAHSGFFGEYSFAQVLIWGPSADAPATTSRILRAAHSAKVSENFVSTASPNRDSNGSPTSLVRFPFFFRSTSTDCAGRLCFLRRRAHALPAFPAALVCKLFPVGVCAFRRGYFFSGAVMGLIGDFQRLGKVLLVIVVVGIVAFYLAERLDLAKG